MIRSLRPMLLLLLVALAAFPVHAQVATGTPPYGSFAGGPDIIDLANLNAHITIPVLHKAGRGMNFTYDLSYDTSVYFPSTASGTNTWTPAGVGSWGWRGQTEVTTGYVSRTATTITCPNPEYPPALPKTLRDTVFSNYVYHDTFGVSHPFNGMTFDPGPCGGQTGATGAATDGSGYSLTVSTSLVSTITSTAGDVIIVPTQSGAGTASKTDRNGNLITVNGSGQFFDTMSSTTPVLTVAGSGTPASPETFTYTAPSGSAVYTVKYTLYSIQTNFGCSGITEYGANGTTTADLVSEIDLPDISVNANDKYTFTYEATPGHTGFVTGRLASVTLPTGGTITYAYTGGSSGHITCADGSAATLTRTTPDGTWIYAHSESGSAWTTLITDPQGNQTNMDFQGIYETQRQVYQGTTSGTLLRQWITCYNGNTSNCNTTAVTLPIAQRTVIDQYGYGSSGLQCKHNYIYNSVGGLTEQDDYDYGSGAPGALLRKTLVTFASLGNITAFQQQVTVYNGAGTQVAQTNYNYDETTPSTSSGVAQHTSVTGSRGNLTSVHYPAGGLIAYYTYWDTGSISTAKDVNGATTTYNYSTNASSCQMAFPTGITEAISTLTQSYSWNCTGGVQLSATDENNQATSTTYSDPYFWRPASANDQQNNVTAFNYGTNPMWMAQSLLFNSNQSIAHTGLGYDELGRLIVTNHAQTPAETAWDQVTQSYDSNGRPWKTSAPCVTTGPWTCPITGQTITYDALDRTSQVTDAGGGTTTYTYNQNDVLVTVGPAPSGEHTKSRQLEYDALGRLTSVCELTTLPGSGTCGQNTTQTGYWTKYTYDPLGDLLTVTQNAQASSGNQQTRTYTYDAMSRLTSEKNPETAQVATAYTYDTIASGTCAGTYYGDLIKRVDPIGNITCYSYDPLHRPLSIAYTTTSPTISTPTKNFVYDSATVDAATMQYAKTRLAEAYTGPSSAKITDEGFSYTARGELTNFYELTPHSNPAYYVIPQTYWPNGSTYQLSNNIATLPLFTYGVDGEGRPSSVSVGQGYGQSPVTSTTYNMYASPNQLTVTFGSGDSDVFTYDPNTLRLNKYQFNVGSQTVTGTLGWNANWSLGSLVITDPLSPTNTQTCSYAADDLARISQTNCGTIWGQNFTYDPFGNITKNKITGSGATFFTPTYQSSPSITNRISQIGTQTPTYDANGNSLNDTFRTSTWDADNNPATIGSVGLTYDAFDRMVEQSVGGTNSEIVYSPAGVKLALMNGTTLTKAFIPLPGGDTAVYTSSGLAYYRHTDHLGSSRFASTPTQTLYADLAYSPFGETYASSGAIDPSFTGQNQDTTAGLYDFLYREYDPNQSRWTSSDPAGLAAVDSTNPQSWNRYAYVVDNPLVLIDPLGLCDPNTTICITSTLCPAPLMCSLGDGNSGSDGSGGVGGLPGGIFGNGHGHYAPLLDGGGGGGGGSSAIGCKNGWGSGGFGVGGGYNVDVGAGVAGASSTGGVDAGLYHNKDGGVFSGYSGGLAASGGMAAYAGSKFTGKPQQTGSTLFVLGAYVGAGANANFTNAASVQQTSGPFTTLSVNVGIGIANLGVQISSGGGIWQVSITPPVVSVGLGAAASLITTNTVTTKTGCKP